MSSQDFTFQQKNDLAKQVALLACLLFSSLACQVVGQLFNTPTPPSPLVNPLFSIEVPQGWRAFSSLDVPPNLPDLDLQAEVLGVVVDTGAVLHTSQQDYFTFTLFILRKPIPDRSNLAEVYQQTYQDIVQVFPDEVKENQTRLQGRPALERVYTYFSGERRYEIRDLWLEKDGFAYILSCRGRNNPLPDLYRQDLQGIVDSFQFK